MNLLILKELNLVEDCFEDTCHVIQRTRGLSVTFSMEMIDHSEIDDEFLDEKTSSFLVQL